MTFLHNVFQDLVDKKLWPIAAALVVALLAMPILIGGGAEPVAEQAAVPGPAAQAANAPPSARAAISLQQEATERRNRGGKRRNPFVQQHLPKATAIAEAADTVKDLASSLAGDTKSDSGSGGSTGPAPTTNTTPVKKQAEKPEASDLYKVNLRFGEAGQTRLRRNVARLSPLPSSTDPFFIFLGVLEDGKTAVFLISSDAVASGDGKCRPTKDLCETLELKVGDSEFFDVAAGTGGVVQYQLDLVSIRRKKASSAKAARASHLRESTAGREYLRAVVAADLPGLDGLTYSTDLGVLMRDETEEQPDELVEDSAGHVPPALVP